jgi:hypothetical protein
MDARGVELASQQPGFLGVESMRGADVVGITATGTPRKPSQWRAHAEHQHFETRGARVERTYGKS